MTREEALNLLQNGLLPQVHGAYYDSLNMAIEALQQQPCEDAISRQAVINALFYASDNNCDVVLSTKLMDRINRLPSVTPETENDKFLEFLWNTINPNEMEQYLAMYHAKEEKVNG